MRKQSINQNNKEPFISIVVPVLNEEKNLPRLFKSFEKLTYPKNNYEIVIIDGGSTDKTVEIAKNFGAKIYKNPLKLRGAGCQIGIEKALGEYIFFTDADCEVPFNWIEGLVKYLNKNKIAGVGGPNQTPKSDSDFSKAVGEVILLLTKGGARYGFSSKKVVEIFHNSGCNAAYKKKAIIEVGGFNKSLVTCEDEELDFRIREKGYTLLYVPNVLVDHYRRPTYKKIFEQARRYAIGRAQAIKLHPKMGKWFHFIPALLLIPLFWPFCLIGFLGSGIFLSIKKGFQPFYVYMIILFLWFFGWGVGFSSGIYKK
jgi:succinoglycan biosynthesis protein ExoA